MRHVNKYSMIQYTYVEWFGEQEQVVYIGYFRDGLVGFHGCLEDGNMHIQEYGG
jgi:hypothetical protein